MEKESIESKIKDMWKKITEESKKRITQWKKPLIIFSAISILGISSFAVYQNGFSYQVNVDGKDIGVAKKEEIVEEAIEIVEDDMIKKYGEKAYFDNKIAVEKVRVKKEEIIGKVELGDKILEEVEIFKPAAIFLVDGQEEIAVNSVENAEAILEEIKEPYIKDKKDESIELIEVSFKQDVEIVSKDVSVEKIVSRRQAMLALGMKKDRVETYTVSRGDTAWNISRSLSMGIRTLEEANPDKDIEKLQPGEEIDLVVPEALLEVVSVERHKSEADIDFETKEKEDASIYKGEKKVEEEGKKGKKEVMTEITFVNGSEIKRKIVLEKVIEEPKDKVVLVGTKERPRSVTSSKANRRNTTSNRTAPTYNGAVGSSIVATARHYLGTPYRSGGSTPAGFDCSGFTSYVYRQYGISIPRTSGGQGSCGSYVSKSQLRPGDIVSFPGHVGIYVGGNSFIHSPSSGKRVEITSLNSSYFKNRFQGGRRPY